MISLDYSIQQIAGVWAMATSQEAWEDRLDRTLDGVFKSFWVLIPSIFISLIYFWLFIYSQDFLSEEVTNIIPRQSLFPGLVIEPISMLIQWSAGLGLLVLVARNMKLGANATDLVIGYNWLLIIQQMMSLIPIIGFIVTQNMAALSLLSVSTLFLSLYLTWGVLHQGLPQLDASFRAGIIVAFLFIYLITNAILNSIAKLFI